MFAPGQSIRIMLCGHAVDMRKSFTGLQVVVRQILGEDPSDGNVYVFINRRGNYLKALYWDQNGWCIWAKRLEQGQYHLPHKGVLKQAVSETQLRLLLEGLSVEITRRYKRYRAA